MKKIKKTTVFFICLISFFILFQSTDKAHATINFPGYLILLATDINGVPIEGVAVKLYTPRHGASYAYYLTSMENGCDVDMLIGSTYIVTCLSHSNASYPSTIDVAPCFQITELRVYIL